MSSNFLTIWWDLSINLAPKWSSGKGKSCVTQTLKAALYWEDDC